MNKEEIEKILEERKKRLKEDGFEPLFGEWPLEEYETSETN